MKKMKIKFIIAVATMAFIYSCGVGQDQITRPKDSKKYSAGQAALIMEGQKLWNDKSLSAGGNKACGTCHPDAETFGDGFAKPYPHKVNMVGHVVTVEGMVQYCILKPMGQKEPLAWDSKELAALTAYTLKLQKDFRKISSK